MNYKTNLLSVLIVFLGVGAALGQGTQPAGPQGPPPGNYSGGGEPAYPYAGSYPAPEVRGVPDARAGLTAAREHYWNVSQDLASLIERMRWEFETSPETRKAYLDQERAWDALQEAQVRVMRSVWDDPEYRAAAMYRQQLSNEIRELWNARKPDENRIYALALTKLNFATLASKREAAAMDKDAQVQQAKRNMVAAGEKVSELRLRFEQKIRQNSEVAAARQAVAQARVAYMTSSAYLDASIRARNVALDFNYNAIQYNPNRFYSPTLFYPSWWWH